MDRSWISIGGLALVLLTGCGGGSVAEVSTFAGGEPPEAATIAAAPSTPNGITWIALTSGKKTVAGCWTPDASTPDGRAYAARLVLLRATLFGTRKASDTGCVTHPYLEDKYNLYGNSNHAGFDFRAPDKGGGTPVFTPADGKVVHEILETAAEQPDPALRHSTLVIQAPDMTGRVTLNMFYLHCQGHAWKRAGSLLSPKLAEGSNVQRGDEVCQTGQVGAPKNPHLHFEVKEAAIQDGGSLWALVGSHCGGTCALPMIRTNTIDPVAWRPALYEEFPSTTLDANVWEGNLGSGPSGFITLAQGVMEIGNGAFTMSKQTLTAWNTLIVEGRFAGPKSWGRDSNWMLWETASGDFIRAGDTNYQSDGLYLGGSGQFALTQAGNGLSVSDYKYYRLTLRGSSVTIERGDSLDAMSESWSGTVPTTTAGKSFKLSLSAGGNDGYYSPADFDWIRVFAY